MSTRQYVGARYVPKFFENPNGSAEWIRNTTYEALTIVTYLGNSYTSKKPVPANTEITDTEYWVVTSNYNAQVEEYRQETEEYKLESERRFDALQKRTFFLFGDSLFDGYDPTSQTRHGWGYWLKQYLEDKGYTVHLATDITTTPYGSAFAGDKTYLMHLNASISAHPEYLNENITDVIVYTGTNDSTHTTTETEVGMSQFVAGIKSHWENANIKIGYFSAFHTPASRAVDTLFREKCGVYGCTYIKNGYGLCVHKAFLSPDNVHLLTEGYKFYSNYLCEGALSGNMHYVFTWEDIKITPNNIGVTFENVGLNIKITDNKLFFTLANIGNDVGHINISQLSGINPAVLNCSFENPTLISVGELVTRGNTYPLYNVDNGNLLGIAEYYFGGYKYNAGNLPFKIYGSIDDSQADVYSGTYIGIILS